MQLAGGGVVIHRHDAREFRLEGRDVGRGLGAEIHDNDLSGALDTDGEDGALQVDDGFQTGVRPDDTGELRQVPLVGGGEQAGGAGRCVETQDGRAGSGLVVVVALGGQVDGTVGGDGNALAVRGTGALRVGDLPVAGQGVG